MLLANRHNQRSAIRKNLLSIDKSYEALSQYEQQRLARLRTTGALCYKADESADESKK
jgi:hypothetical protein